MHRSLRPRGGPCGCQLTHTNLTAEHNPCLCREMEMERLRLRDEVESLQMQLASLEGETPRAFNDDTLRRAPLRVDASNVPVLDVPVHALGYSGVHSAMACMLLLHKALRMDEHISASSSRCLTR